MASKQLSNGNKDEREASDIFRSHGFWVHIIAKSSSGAQPVDIVAIRREEAWLVDSKNVRRESCSFPFSRIESNQETTMAYANGFAGIPKERMGFVIFFERDGGAPRFLSYSSYLEMKGTKKSVNMDDLPLLDPLL